MALIKGSRFVALSTTALRDDVSVNTFDWCVDTIDLLVYCCYDRRHGHCSRHSSSSVDQDPRQHLSPSVFCSDFVNGARRQSMSMSMSIHRFVL
jgi:hypothetical protein